MTERHSDTVFTLLKLAVTTVTCSQVLKVIEDAKGSIHIALRHFVKALRTHLRQHFGLVEALVLSH